MDVSEKAFGNKGGPKRKEVAVTADWGRAQPGVWGVRVSTGVRDGSESHPYLV